MSHLHTVCTGHVSPQHSLSRTCLTSTQFVKDMSHLHTVCKGHISPQHSLSKTCLTSTQFVKDMSHLHTVCKGHVSPQHSLSRTCHTFTQCVKDISHLNTVYCRKPDATLLNTALRKLTRHAGLRTGINTIASLDRTVNKGYPGG